MLKKLLPFIFLVLVILQGNAQTGTHGAKSAQTVSADSVLQVIDLKLMSRWSVATTPRNQPALFPEGSAGNGFASRINCAKTCWYIVDPLFYDKNTNLLPANIKNDPNALSSFYVNQVWEHDVFPEVGDTGLNNVNLSIFNLGFYPDEKGLFNFDAAPGMWSAGIDTSGHLKNPQSRWGGIMRPLEGYYQNWSPASSSQENIPYKTIDFWLMDPFVESPLNEGGDFYIDMGNVSEDILDPGILNTENGDKGFDNMDDNGERTAYKTYLDTIAGIFGSNSPAYLGASQDPSGDDYHYFRGSDYDQQQLGLLDRYKYYNGSEGNSTSSQAEYYITIATNRPDNEDINRNTLLDTVEGYCQYKINLSPANLLVGKNHITERRTATTTFPNGITASVHWYHFQIPTHEPDTIIGNFGHVGSTGFMRIFLKGFNTETHLRFATFELSYMKERAYRDRITVYPNPTQGSVTIDFDNRTPHAMMLYDQTGRLLRNQIITPGTGQKVDFNLSTLSNGVYFFKLFADQETVVKKVVVEK